MVSEVDLGDSGKGACCIAVPSTCVATCMTDDDLKGDKYLE